MDSLETQLDVMLHRPEPAIGDGGFSEDVMRALPARRFAGAKARRWTLGGAAVAGGLLAVLLGAPLENAFSSLILDGDSLAPILAVIFVAVVAAPTVWAFYSE
jgi:hypothetical protein